VRGENRGQQLIPWGLREEMQDDTAVYLKDLSGLRRVERDDHSLHCGLSRR